MKTALLYVYLLVVLAIYPLWVGWDHTMARGWTASLPWWTAFAAPMTITVFIWVGAIAAYNFGGN